MDPRRRAGESPPGPDQRRCIPCRSLCLATVSQWHRGSAMSWSLPACWPVCRVRNVAGHATDLLFADRLAGLGCGGRARAPGPDAATGGRRPSFWGCGRGALRPGGSRPGWRDGDGGAEPALPDRMPQLVDDDLLFGDAGVPRPSVAVNRWLRELPVSGAAAPGTWAKYARALRDWMTFLPGLGIGVFDTRDRLKQALGA